MTAADFGVAWMTLTQATVNIGGTQYISLCEDVKKKYIKPEMKHISTATHDDKLGNFSQYFTSNFGHSQHRLTNCECNDSHKLEIESWKKENKRFVNTPAIDAILNILKDKHFITITGRSGVGKSASLHHVAFHFLEKKYDIIPCKNPAQIFSHFKTNRYQAFILDGVCWKNTEFDDEVKLWIKNERNIMNLFTTNTTKIIATSPLHVYKDHQFQRIRLFTTNSINLSSDEYALSPRIKHDMLLKYIPDISQEEANVISVKVLDIFPVLCNLYTPKLNIIDFFKNPFETLSKELDTLYKTKLCALFLLIVYNGTIDISFFKKQSSKKTVNGILENWEKGNVSTLSPLQYYLDACVDKYVKKVGGQYITIHDTVFDFLCFYFGKRMPTSVIKYADSKILRRRFQLESLRETQGEYTIMINNENEDLYFARILHDLSEGKVLDVFCNIQMSFQKYRYELMQHIKSLEESKIKQLLNKCEISRATLLPLYVVSRFGFQDLTRLILQYTDNKNSFKEDLPLNVACSSGKVNVIDILIAEGFDISCSNSAGITCLHEACETGQTRIVETLLEKGANINASTANGCTPLIVASNGGHTETVKILLQNGAEIDTRNSYGCTALFYACYNGHMSTIELLVKKETNVKEDCTTYSLLAACLNGYAETASNLISKGANVKYIYSNGVTLLMMASFSGNAHLVDILLSNGAIEQINSASHKEGITPLITAAAGGHVNIVNLLLKHNADANVAAKNGFTATMVASLNGYVQVVDFLNHNKNTLERERTRDENNLMAACTGGHVDMVKFLIEKGENIKYRSKSNWCPLIVASKFGNHEVISFLLSKGLDINSSDLLGNTALVFACFFERLKSVEVLIKNSVDINKGNKYGHSPIIVASRISQCVLKILIDNEASINQKDLSGRSALMHACITGNANAVEILFNNEVDIKDIDNCQWNSLMFSCASKNAEITEMLIAKSSDLNHTDENGCTSLMIASFNGNVDAVQILLDNDANLNARDELQWSPLMWSCRGRRVSVVELLLNYGADANLVSTDNTTPLFWACEEGENQIVDLLISKTTSEDNMNSWAHLMWAARKGKTRNAKTLIGKGVEINKGDSKGRTPLMISCCYRNSQIVELLMEHKANINKVDTDGWTALNWAKRLKDLTIIDLLQHHCADEKEDYFNEQLHFISACACGNNDLVNSFIQNKIDLNSKANTDSTALMLAVKGERCSTARILLLNEADVNKSDYHNNTPLIEASRSGNMDVVSLLLEYKANINDSNHIGNTALIEASKLGHIDVVKKLLKSGADILHVNKKDWDAISEARLHGNIAIVKILEEPDTILLGI
ncbi:Hypothetical predicted protein [Mytilus galloprovincialis]|uniref:Novel STAND NTPase 3 domain-containing protein n=1 Tax=Mytilus galloprovincialis TaxID=29158 RepID=A0A8B6D8S1_MYTGA|nr:Hypothetical predicted protein [Mytilus galloprovincialis]